MASESSPANFNNGPSSPDDSFSSPIANTSSPAHRRRRGRRQASTPSSAAATPPPNPSRFANSASTPTPARSTRRGRRPGPATSPSPAVAATPSSTDDFSMPSSEGGEDMEEATPTFVWGTNISVQDVKNAIQMFIKHFRDPQELSNDIYGEGKYTRLIHRVLEVEGEWIDVDAHDVFNYDSDLYNKMMRYPLEVLAIFDIVLMDIVSVINPLFDKHVQVRIHNLKSSTSMRNLNPSDIEKMVSLKGMVIRCSSIIPEIREAVFRCIVCGYHSEPVVVDRGRISEPTSCLKQECLAKNSMALVHNRCRFADKQIVRLQETPDEIPEGGTPHTVSLLMHDKLVDAGKPGDRVEVTGIYRAMSVRVGPTQRTVKSLFKTYIDCLHIKKTDKSRMTAEDPMEVDKGSQRVDDDVQFDEDKVEELKELSKQPDIYERLTRSLAPNIWELDDVKKCLLCQLFGGNALKLLSGASFRGDVNILLVGDPGTSKSQLLQYIHKLAPRGIYTSGRGSSAVGLTAYVAKDPETGETVLESGALVLSDRGICCIDEFDKMSDNARSMLHEVMEQQTVSIAKAGIIASLNARTSVLACANPSGSRYNPRLSVIDNIHLPPTLLSRFDLIYLILDKADEQTDRRLAKHIVSLHFEDTEIAEHDVIDLATLTAYVSYARKNIHPKLSDEAAEELTRGYVEMRKRGNFPGSSKKVITATPRQIESLIRLSEALARIRFSETVEMRDVTEAFRLLEVAMQQSATDHSTGTIDMDLITTGVSASERMRRESVLSATRNIIMDKLQLGGPSIRLLELLDEMKKQNSGTEIHLHDLRTAVATLASEGFVVLHGDTVPSPSSSCSSSLDMWNYFFVPILLCLTKELSLAKAQTSTGLLLPSQRGDGSADDSLISFSSCANADPKLYYRPVIGILSHPGDGASGRLNNDTNASYIAASYVKFVEAAGARVIPLIYNEPEEILFQKLELVNGVLFTGGWSKYGLYYDIAKKIFKKVIEKNDRGDHFPLYAVCLGFELLTMIISEDKNILEPFSASNQASSLQFVENVNVEGTVFQRFPPNLLQKLGTDCLVMQNHRYGISPEKLQNTPNLSRFFKILTTSTDKNNKVYVSTAEAHGYPVTAFQWHPEKNAFEWGLPMIPHTDDAIEVTQHVANFLIREARRSLNRPATQKVLDSLIYNYSPTYCGKAGKGFDEVYIFTQRRARI